MLFSTRGQLNCPLNTQRPGPPKQMKIFYKNLSMSQPLFDRSFYTILRVETVYLNILFQVRSVKLQLTSYTNVDFCQDHEVVKRSYNNRAAFLDNLNLDKHIGDGRSTHSNCPTYCPAGPPGPPGPPGNRGVAHAPPPGTGYRMVYQSQLLLYYIQFIWLHTLLNHMFRVLLKDEFSKVFFVSSIY